MKLRLLTGLVNALVATALLGTGAVAHAKSTDPAAGSSPKPATKKKAAKDESASKAVTTKFMRGSEESAGERNARLKRECKGAVNAGACAGYTR